MCSGGGGGIGRLLAPFQAHGRLLGVVSYKNTRQHEPQRQDGGGG